MAFPNYINEQTLTIFIGLDSYPIPTSHANYDAIKDLALNGNPDTDEQALLSLIDPMQIVPTESFDGTDVEVTAHGVTYRGEYLPYYLQKRILDMIKEGLDPTPWKKFVERVYQNPLESARRELALFMDTAQFPITDEGKFWAYKTVRDTYFDWHTNSMDNSPGRVVEMEREEVDPDRDRTCSTGLHFCAKSYLESGAMPRTGGRVVIVEIDPADVVAIPSDYSNTKGRAWRYKVVGEIPLSDLEKHEWGIYAPTAAEDDDEDVCPSCGSDWCHEYECEDDTCYECGYTHECDCHLSGGILTDDEEEEDTERAAREAAPGAFNRDEAPPEPYPTQRTPASFLRNILGRRK